MNNKIQITGNIDNFECLFIFLASTEVEMNA